MIRNGNAIPQMKRAWNIPTQADAVAAIASPLLLAGEKIALYLPMDGANIGDRLCVFADITLTGANGTYAPCVFATPEGEIVDYGLERGCTSSLQWNATVCEYGGRACVLLYLLAGKGETVAVDSLRCGEPSVEKPLLGGAELIMMEPQHKQMMGFLLRTPEGKVLVFDGGNVADTDALGEQILAWGGCVDGWFITHYHNDHVAAVVGVLEKYPISVNGFYYDFRGAENPNFIGDGDNEWITRLEETLRRFHPQKIREVTVTNRADVYDFGSVRVKVLNDAVFYEDAENPGNDSGVVYKIETPGEHILMLGDLGWTHGDVCLGDPWFLEEMRTCRIVQMAHHGQNGTTRRFYDAIDEILVCLYPADQWLFDVDRREQGFASGPWRTLETRAWMRSRKVLYTYSSIDGRLTLR